MENGAFFPKKIFVFGWALGLGLELVLLGSMTLVERRLESINPMFGLRERNEKEEKKNKGERENVGSSDMFFIKFGLLCSI